jgi:hypothetical protein
MLLGPFSLGTSSLGIACLVLQSISDVLLLQVSPSQSFISSSQSFSGAGELGKRLRSSSCVVGL